MNVERLEELRALAEHGGLDSQTQMAVLSEVQRWREEVNVVSHRAHFWRVKATRAEDEVARIRSRLRVLQCDPDDRKAVDQLLQDVKAYRNAKRRVETGKLREGEGLQPGTQAHYDAKLAGKKARIQELEAVVCRYRKALDTIYAAGSSTGAWEIARRALKEGDEHE